MLRSPVVLLAGLLLAATAAAQHWAPATQPVPLPRPLGTLPYSLSGWVPVGDADAALLPGDPHPDASFTRAYRRDGTTLYVSVTYYARQQDTRRLLAASALEPRGGWIDPVKSMMDLAVTDGPMPDPIHAATLLLRRGEQRYALIYWYQLGSRTFSGDLRYRASLLANTLFRRRSEGTLVKIAAVVPAGAADPFAGQRAFVRDFYPELLRSVPL
jgi:EpsI family protein